MWDHQPWSQVASCPPVPESRQGGHFRPGPMPLPSQSHESQERRGFLLLGKGLEDNLLPVGLPRPSPWEAEADTF